MTMIFSTVNAQVLSRNLQFSIMIFMAYFGVHFEIRRYLTKVDLMVDLVDISLVDMVHMCMPEILLSFLHNFLFFQFRIMNLPDIGATELILSNGMRVCYKRTEFLDDQVNGHFLMPFMSCDLSLRTFPTMF